MSLSVQLWRARHFLFHVRRDAAANIRYRNRHGDDGLLFDWAAIDTRPLVSSEDNLEQFIREAEALHKDALELRGRQKIDVSLLAGIYKEIDKEAEANQPAGGQS